MEAVEAGKRNDQERMIERVEGEGEEEAVWEARWILLPTCLSPVACFLDRGLL